MPLLHVLFLSPKIPFFSSWVIWFIRFHLFSKSLLSFFLFFYFWKISSTLSFRPLIFSQQVISFSFNLSIEFLKWNMHFLVLKIFFNIYNWIFLTVDFNFVQVMIFFPFLQSTDLLYWGATCWHYFILSLSGCGFS